MPVPLSANVSNGVFSQTIFNDAIVMVKLDRKVTKELFALFRAVSGFTWFALYIFLFIMSVVYFLINICKEWLLRRRGENQTEHQFPTSCKDAAIEFFNVIFMNISALLLAKVRFQLLSGTSCVWSKIWQC